jgi:hypothetical protein
MTIGKSKTESSWNNALNPSSGVLLLFLLLFSGPPKLRMRDPGASLEGLIDWSVLLNVSVWIVGGIWVWSKRRLWPLTYKFALMPLEEKLTLTLFGFLAISICFSPAPAFSAFKVYQLIVTYVFIRIFIKQFGISQLLKAVFWCCAILSLADVAAGCFAPSLVFFESELGTLRFRGDLIAQTGVVSLIGLILLLTSQSDLPKKNWTFWFVVFSGVLVFSLMRTSYVAMVFVLILAVIKRPAIPILKRLSTFALLSAPLFLGFILGALDKYRKAEDIWTLSSRIGLWTYLLDATVSQGPWLGLGYFAASRVYAPEFNPELGTAHSAFMEIYVGGGLVSLLLFCAIWIVVATRTTRLFFRRSDKYAFAIVSLFFAALLLNLVGGELQAEPSGFCFWCLVTVVPAMTLGRNYQPQEIHGKKIVPGLRTATPK